MNVADATKSLLDYVDFIQVAASHGIDSDVKPDLEQYFSSMSLARLMASMFRFETDPIRILDPGAGVGMLFAACVEAILQRELRPTSILVSAYEVDHSLADDIRDVFKICAEACSSLGVKFEGELIEKDFVLDAAEKLGLSVSSIRHFDCVIMNPPYQKIKTSSHIHRALELLGMESPNYYTAFMEMAEQFLDHGGEMVSITPRSFCNGLYFRPFRSRFLGTMSINRIHLFTSRTKSFREDEVLQENIILYSVKGVKRNRVIVSSSEGPEDELTSTREVEASSIVLPDDPEFFIHIVPDEIGRQIASRMDLLKTNLEEIHIDVSTGKVVDFRCRDFLRYEPGTDTVPLIHPTNLNTGGFVRWPISSMKKAAYLKATDESQKLLVPRGNYVLVKRFTTNEEKKRIVAAVYDADKFKSPFVAFENRVNYFHRNGVGLDIDLAKGLAVFLNSTVVDSYFRQISGHTQVNSTDLRNLRYPSPEQLKSLGSRISNTFPDQKLIDEMVEKELFKLPNDIEIDPVAAQQKIREALSVLRMLDLPREQLNVRSALTLLALLDLKPKDSWSQAGRPLSGITPMMDFFAKHYGKKYAPNTRETVRRYTVHQFCQAGLTIENPDDPKRPTNSPKAVYQVEENAFKLLRSFGTSEWEKNLRTYRASTKSLREKYARERERQLIPIKISDTQIVHLTPGGQNTLVQKLVGDFLPIFVPDGKILYIGDTGEKFAHFDKEALSELGVEVEPHGKMPDVIVYDKTRNWLFMVEAVTSHGPISPKRREELERIFSSSKAGIVYVTAFLDRASMVTYLREISWETEVWVAESPSHMIHFNGERFLGPYES